MTRTMTAELTSIVALTRPSYQVVARLGTNAQAIDIKQRPEFGTTSDMVRVIEDDGEYRIIHMTHNEVIKGEARLSHSLTGFVGTMVQQLVEGF